VAEKIRRETLALQAPTSGLPASGSTMTKVKKKKKKKKRGKYRITNRYNDVLLPFSDSGHEVVDDLQDSEEASGGDRHCWFGGTLVRPASVRHDDARNRHGQRPNGTRVNQTRPHDAFRRTLGQRYEYATHMSLEKEKLKLICELNT
jgi:hypothetical protein